MADNQRPLAGVILCCTSIPPEQRRDLAAIAEEMGAVHKLDLTSDVTHLIVGETDTPKYKFVAKERPDVKCLRPSWVEAVRECWLEGGETDVEALEIEHKLPTFVDLIICVTGFEDLDFRKQLEDSITGNGGQYRGNLTRDCTHLIANVPSGAKYSHAGSWGIKIVAVEWLEQSIERGMTLDESLYNLAIPASERGKNAWTRRTISTASLGKRSREDEFGPQNPRKLRRTASARLSSQNFGLWTDIVGIESKPVEIRAGQWDIQAKDSEVHEIENRAISEKRPKETLDLKIVDLDPGTNVRLTTDDLPQRKGMFQGRTFLLHGFDEKKSSILQEHLLSHGADILTDVNELPLLEVDVSPECFYYLVPHSMARCDVPTLPATGQTPTIVTEFWVERCLFKKKFEKPGASVLNSPFSCFPITGFEKLSVCSTSFQGIDLSHVSKAVKLMGATYEEFFSPSASVLVCNSVVPGHEKLLHAQVWNVPAVTANWLWESINKGELMPFGAYLVQPVGDPNRRLIDAGVVKKHERLAQTRDTKTLVDPVETKASKPTRIKSLVKEIYRHPTKETFYQCETSESNKDSSSKALAEPRREILPNDDNQAPINRHDNPPKPNKTATEARSPHAPNTSSLSTPLNEITPNSSPPKQSTSPTKSVSPIKPTPTEPSSLGPAISSLLAHHQQRTHSTTARAPTSSDPTRTYRRRRHLLGRAPSNLSSHSISTSINASRASSVDTLNTDGLGTPLESTKPNTNTTTSITTTKTNPHPFFIASHHHNQHENDPDWSEPTPQMTQLGYEDLEVKAWRERVAVKMSGGVVGKEKTPARKKSVAGNADTPGLGIAKRTRGAAGGGR